MTALLHDHTRLLLCIAIGVLLLAALTLLARPNSRRPDDAPDEGGEAGDQLTDPGIDGDAPGGAAALDTKVAEADDVADGDADGDVAGTVETGEDTDVHETAAQPAGDVTPGQPDEQAAAADTNDASEDALQEQTEADGSVAEDFPALAGDMAADDAPVRRGRLFGRRRRSSEVVPAEEDAAGTAGRHYADGGDRDQFADSGNYRPRHAAPDTTPGDAADAADPTDLTGDDAASGEFAAWSSDETEESSHPATGDTVDAAAAMQDVKAVREDEQPAEPVKQGRRARARARAEARAAARARRREAPAAPAAELTGDAALTDAAPADTVASVEDDFAAYAEDDVENEAANEAEAGVESAAEVAVEARPAGEREPIAAPLWAAPAESTPVGRQDEVLEGAAAEPVEPQPDLTPADSAFAGEIVETGSPDTGILPSVAGEASDGPLAGLGIAPEPHDAEATEDADVAEVDDAPASLSRRERAQQRHEQAAQLRADARAAREQKIADRKARKQNGAQSRLDAEARRADARKQEIIRMEAAAKERAERRAAEHLAAQQVMLEARNRKRGTPAAESPGDTAAAEQAPVTGPDDQNAPVSADSEAKTGAAVAATAAGVLDGTALSEQLSADIAAAAAAELADTAWQTAPTAPASPNTSEDHADWAGDRAGDLIAELDTDVQTDAGAVTGPDASTAAAGLGVGFSADDLDLPEALPDLSADWA